MKFKPLIPFIKKSFLFTIGFIVLVYLMESFFNFSIRRIGVGEYGVLNKINKGEINTDILISGSSRALKGINPIIIKKLTGLSCYNIASDGADIGVQVPKLKWYLTNNKKPKVLIQDISQYFGGLSNSIYEPAKYLPYLSNDSLYQGLLRIDETFWLHKYLPVSNIIFYNFDFYSKLLKELKNNSLDKEEFINGFLPDSSAWTSDFELYKKQNPKGIESSIEKNYKSYLINLKNYCEENNIILILTILPNYYRLSEVARNTKSISDFYLSLQNPPHVFFIDYGNSSISQDEDNFYNFTHLNLNGSNQFTELLVKELFLISLESNLKLLLE